MGKIHFMGIALLFAAYLAGAKFPGLARKIGVA